MTYATQMMFLTLMLALLVSVGFSMLTPLVEGLMDGAFLNTAAGFDAKFVKP